MLRAPSRAAFPRRPSARTDNSPATADALVAPGGMFALPAIAVTNRTGCVASLNWPYFAATSLRRTPPCSITPGPVALTGPGVPARRLESCFCRRGSEIFQAQYFAVVIVRENFGVAAPVDHGVEHPLRLFFRQVVFELAQKPRCRGTVAGPLVEDATYVGGQRHVLQQRLGKDLLAGQHVRLGVRPAEGRQLDVAAADMGEAEQLQCLDQREQLVHDEVFLVGEVGQIGAAMVRRLRQILDQTRELLDRGIGQAKADTDRFGFCPTPPVAPGLGRQECVDLVDDLAKTGALGGARAG